MSRLLSSMLSIFSIAFHLGYDIIFVCSAYKIPCMFDLSKLSPVISKKFCNEDFRFSVLVFVSVRTSH